MESIEYYRQTPIMRRILEYVDSALYVSASDPRPDRAKSARRYSDIIEAMDGGFDLFRSVIDSSGVLLPLDFEYANSVYSGEIFHNPLVCFDKMSSTNKAIKSLFDKNEIKYIELMTGRGYNYVTKIDRYSQSYNALLNIGKRLKVLPESAIEKLSKKEEQHGNIPLIEDNLVFSAFGRISDYILDKIKPYSTLPLKSSDIFDENEIEIFDTTLFGYLIHRRSIRSAFSLHQKFKMNPSFNYSGPAIVAIPTEDLSLEDLVKIRQDERKNYKKACDLASGVNTEIPSSDLTCLITDYLMSPTFEYHSTLSKELKSQSPEVKWDSSKLQERLNNIESTISPDDVWKPRNGEDVFKRVIDSKLDNKALEILHHPNDLLLNPNSLKHFIKNCRDKKFNRHEVISLIAHTYSQDHGWNQDLYKNDFSLRAEYWVRTLWND